MQIGKQGSWAIHYSLHPTPPHPQKLGLDVEVFVGKEEAQIMEGRETAVPRSKG